jgi:YVTN family beta-propeller protein
MRIVRSLGALAVLAALCLAMGVPSASAAAVVNTIPVGMLPDSVSSDGTHVWVANNLDDTVSEIEASSGTVVNTIPIPLGAVGEMEVSAGSVSSDGTHAWVTSSGITCNGSCQESDMVVAAVTEIDASTGTVVNTIPVSAGAAAVSSDGTHVWVTSDGAPGTVSEIDASTGTMVNTITVGNEPDAVSSDGTHVWVANYADGTVSEIDASTGTVVNTIPVGGRPDSVSSDGTHVWVGNTNSQLGAHYAYGTVSEIDASTGTVVNTIPVGYGFDGVSVSSDGTHVWVANEGEDTVSEIEASSGTVVDTIPVGIFPDSVSSDGIHVWVANWTYLVDESIDGTVSEIQIGPSAPDIVATPDAATRSTSATFEFTSDTDGAQFECSLDGSAFSACSSPQTYSDLGDGGHTFQVREDDPGEPLGPVSEFDWSVYTHPPTVSIDSAPSGSANDSTATVVFHGSAEDGFDAAIAFTCSLDGAAAVPCSSPDLLTGLADGTHTISISAEDDVGNVSTTPASAMWTVSGESLPPESSCSGPSQDSASNGDLVMVARDGSCITAAKRSGVDVWQTSGVVTLNGITVTPDPGTTLSLTRGGSAPTFASSGGVSVQLGSLPSVHAPAVAWVQGAGALLDMASPLPVVKSLAGLLAKIDFASIDLGSDKGGSAKFTLTITLPSDFSDLPEDPSKPAAPAALVEELSLETSNDEGLDFSGKVSVPSAYLGEIEIKDLELEYDAVDKTFDGSLGVSLSEDSPTIAVSVSIGPPGPVSVFGCCLRSLSIGLQDINKPIPDTPLYLQSIGGAVQAGGAATVPYVTVTGTAGVSVGPSFEDFPAIVALDGSLSLTLADPWKLTVAGKATVGSFPLVNGKATYTEGEGVSLEGSIDATIEGYGFMAQVTPSTFFQGTTSFNIDALGTVELGLLGSAQGEVVFSNHGLAACATIKTPFETYEAGWGELAGGTVQPFVGTCNMGPYSSTLTEPPAMGARTSAAGGAVRLPLTSHAGQRLVAVRGEGAAPELTIRGPHGFALAGGTAASEGRDGLIIPDPNNDTTYVMLKGVAAGVYTVTSSNTTIASISTADSLPPVSVVVKTRMLPGGKRRLTYAQRTAPGQQLELFEQGKAGSDRLLLRTSRAHGQLTYTPAVGFGAKRAIRAITLAHGLPRADQTLAPYRVNDSPPGRVRSLAHHGRLLTWNSTPRAVGYMLSFTTLNGTTPAVTTRARTVRLPTDATAATIVAIDAAGRPGPATTIKLRSPVAHPHKPK